MNPRRTSNLISINRDPIPRHTHAGKEKATTGGMGRRTNPRRKFALLTVEVARAAGLLDADGELIDHELTVAALVDLAFATVSDKTGADDALETQAPALLREHGHRDAIAAQLTHGADMLPFPATDGATPAPGDLTFWVEATPRPTPIKARAFVSFRDLLTGNVADKIAA